MALPHEKLGLPSIGAMTPAEARATTHMLTEERRRLEQMLAVLDEAEDRADEEKPT